MQSQAPKSTESERIKLLEKIHELESNAVDYSNIPKALRDLKSRYNELVEATFQYPNYLEYFPTEIWIQVFLRITEDDWMDILPLMQVCQRWTSIIVSEPRLWTSIYIRSNVESLELAYSALHLSKDFPLNLTIQAPMDPNIHRALIQKDTSRVQHMRLEKSSLNYENDERFMKTSASVLKDLGPLPSLHSLTINIDPTTDDNMWSPILVNLDAPQIRYIESAVFSRDVLATSRYTRLQVLGTSSTLESVLPEMVKFTDLKRLTLLARPKVDEPAPSSESPVVPCEDMAPLKGLGYLQEYSDAIWPVLKHVSSSLRVLELEITGEQLMKLFTVIQDVHYLHDLSLCIPASSITSSLEGNRWKAPTLPRVQRFALEIIDSFVGGQVLISSPFNEPARVVLKALDNSLPHVHTLHLKSEIYTNDLVRLVETMEDLTALDLMTVVPSDRSRKATCATLKTLRAQDQNILYYLTMPNLSSIKFLYVTMVEEEVSQPIDCSFANTVQSIVMQGQHASTILANGGEFTQLSTLEWYSCRHGYNYRDDSLPSLTKIIFSYQDVPQSGTAFCESLLRYPRSCPRLETIRFWEHPEWDMLLYMLLRRNVHLIQTNISRISKIEIRGFPGPSILVPLNTLLLGKIPVEMPSPEELSFVEIQEIHFDRTMYVKSRFTETVTNRMNFVPTGTQIWV
jgi:hypothetical protein